MMNRNGETEIRTRPRPQCYLCGAEGKSLYQGLPDGLFGSGGKWNIKRCQNPECGLLWLDPMPIEEDIALAYRDYYTHPDSTATLQPSSNLTLRGMLRNWANLFLRLTPIYKERQRVWQMYLGKVKPGRILDVGCGDGRRLAEMKKCGWDVLGLDLDPAAATFAHDTFGISVQVGTLEEANFPTETFDAVIASHVIEHIFDPISFLTHCYEILKPGGRLVMVTPNSKSTGHWSYKANWIGLDPPRHLHVFSQESLRLAAQKAGLAQYKIWTTAANAQLLAIGSVALRKGDPYGPGKYPRFTTHLESIGFQLWASFRHAWNKNLGDECVLQAIK
ncbi:MAG: class I SAM-dependent methyltransferase [Anaerolineae bacterium]|nr:class I SAM-dependent methyltransferase [Anaerolineae bacterium]